MKKLLLLGFVALVGLSLMVLPLGLAADSSATTTGGSAAGVAGLPPVLGQAYTLAAQKVHDLVPACQGMRWEILAGVAEVETTQAAGHQISADGEITPLIYGPLLDGTGAGGNTTAVVNTTAAELQLDAGSHYARAVGLFQFMPATWLSTGVNARGTGAAPDPDNAFDAALTAAVYLCGNGRDLTQPAQLAAALLAYNHSDAYVQQVEAAIAQYDALASVTSTIPASGKAAIVLRAAMAQFGVPYSWGGGNATGPTRGQCCSPGGQDGSRITGFDCSGLTLYAYAQVGITLPRTAAEQAGVGRRIPASAGLGALRPGDLIFYGYIPGDDASIYHVAIYAGAGMQIAAPRPGEGVLEQPVDIKASTFAGGTQIL
ncbi:C40 family peptidase [Streptacidiphilus anmyonensis]|uniref:C40 family peptidase n=1 Tax=Streptacidiphilus anmyonensis TaxID=405782 RepID=UPI0007C68A17|nr:C40 family peptidase [Streptacidiphilus anmyonensis]